MVPLSKKILNRVILASRRTAQTDGGHGYLFSVSQRPEDELVHQAYRQPASEPAQALSCVLASALVPRSRHRELEPRARHDVERL